MKLNPQLVACESRIETLKENYNRVTENDSATNKHFNVSNWSHCLVNETGDKLIEYATFEEYESAEWLLNSHSWEKRGISR